MKTKLGLVVVVALAVAAALFACGTQGFDPISKVDSVRLFVVGADKPYARNGDTVTLQALWTDGRRDRARQAKLYWIPILCLNPRDDLYYLCFANPGDATNQAGATRLIPLGPLADAGAAGGADAGAPGGNPFAGIPTGVDLGPLLPQGDRFTFQLPNDAVQPREGSDPYGLAVIFNVLCAGRLEFAARDPNGGAQQVPVRCTDENGVQLPPSDYVIGVSRVYAWDVRTNANPNIEKLTFEGKDVDLAAGITVERCTAAKEADCKENKLDVRVSDDSWEENPADVTRDGPLHEQIWADYYADIGKIDDGARLLFETSEGRLTDTENVFRAPPDVVDGTLWVVVHDNRGGSSWRTVPLHVR
ncbi:MAG: hypothetical protein JWP97_6050 [Labilithrix sp.]|nr:hypothetical protein [Labilithrix sp.]